MKNPKSEIRNPKEIRSSKSEPELLDDSRHLCECAEVFEGGEMVLKDGPSIAHPVRDLQERSAVFAEEIIRFAKRIPETSVNTRLISQLVGCASSIGANYCEADNAVSGKEFKQKIGFCRKESKEAMFFLRLVATSEPNLADEARKLWREAKELNLIFGSIWRK